MTELDILKSSCNIHGGKHRIKMAPSISFRSVQRSGGRIDPATLGHSLYTNLGQGAPKHGSIGMAVRYIGAFEMEAG